MQTLIATGRSGALVALGEAERPRPRPGEVLIKVEAFSVNRGEMFSLQDRGPGWRPGKDVAGVVVQAAADAAAPAPGQQVTGPVIVLNGGSSSLLTCQPQRLTSRPATGRRWSA